MSGKQHVLKCPGMYFGEVVPAERTFWVVHEGRMQERTALVNHGPYNLLNEVLVNARDHAEKGKGVSFIKVHFDAASGTMSVENDVEAIPIVQRPGEDVYLPELVFAHLRSSSNFNRSAAPTCVGGQNGYGVKLVAIWSTLFELDLVGPDADGKLLRYEQKYKNNLSVVEPPTIKPYKKAKCYTKITFRLDWDRFGSTMDEAMVEWMKRRVYDIAAVTDKKIKVFYNGEVVPVKSFPDYVAMYLGDAKIVTEKSPRWEYAVAVMDSTEFKHVSFVNGIHTSKGGRHVDYILNQIIAKVGTLIQRKKKSDEPVRASFIKNHLFLFLDSCIENPTFDSQTKDTLTTQWTKFGSTCEVSDKFVEKLLAAGLSEIVADQMKSKQAASEAKTDGRKKRTITGIPKLCDAFHAGTAKSRECTLILTEGDSAKSAVIGGLSEKMRQTIGVYPLKGKMINPRVRNASENKELIELKQILGLKSGHTYTADSISELRYGKVMIVTDQDLDGRHIQGLIANMFSTLWPSLLSDESFAFLSYMNTPIIKARKGAQERVFYSEQEYHKWEEAERPKGWTTKYYKGLGTSTSKEFAEYFQEGKSSVVAFEWGDTSADALSKVFDGNRADDRKAWLSAYDASKAEGIDPKSKRVKYEHFVDVNLIEFSMYDNKRSIPNMMDGLKPSQRKILYACFKKDLHAEIKVAQLSGYVSEHTAYHHGEASLNGAIVGMAQNFVGSNNVNLLEPIGQFGTRLGGGDDSASERYIFTKLSPLTRFIFRQEDDAVLDYVKDDGKEVEPVFFVPIIPMALVNPIKGIGTGWCTELIGHDPSELVDYIIAKLKDPDTVKEGFTPFYKGFEGVVEPISPGKWNVRGCFERKDEVTYMITELPVGVWTNDYKQFLETLVESGVVKSYADHCTDVAVKFEIKLVAAVENFEKTFKLAVTKSSTNMNLFNAESKLVKYGTVMSIVDEFIPVRRAFYAKRKDHQLAELQEKLTCASNKVRYIQGVLSGAFEMRGLGRDDIHAMLKEGRLEEIGGDFNYLLNMPMISVSKENVAKFEREMADLQHRSKTLQGTTIDDIWIKDLGEFKNALQEASAPSKKRPRSK